MHPSSTSNVYQIQHNTYSVYLNDTGIMGDYASNGTSSKCIWTIGTSWPLGNMYGLAYQYSSSSYLGTDHTISILENGGAYTRINMGGGIWTTGTMAASGQMYTPEYYDWNNTGYYVVPSNYSQFSGVYANNWLRPQGSCGVYWQSYGYGIWSANNSGSYGNVGTYGTGLNGWSGYNIGPCNVTFMANGSNWGMYNAPGGQWHFYCGTSGSYTAIGTGNINTGYNITLNGSVYCTSSMYAAGNVYAYSDARKKENIETIQNALDIVLKLRGVFYNRKREEVIDVNPGVLDERTEEYKFFGPSLKRQVGVIAQETEPHLPEVVNYDEVNDEYGVNYGNMAGVFIEAFRGQQNIIEAQAEKIANQEERLAKLEALISQLTK
jgi:hypothetical protein